ncbi:LmbE-like protein [Lentinula lateritia]|uniref:LmbE-like protein n=1 Tax=Lentinula aff. lateritia TaxID=2804960 RepID=A0ACC1U6B1_9AGAR|nr:LmbE-like protein [Lentinula aff. lateritia]KAJ3850868.1 LmbE-like protein [Lentinula lateritia]
MFFSSFHVLVLSIVIAILYRPTYSGDSFKGEFPKLTQHQRVLLVTAHPDDECLFFAPTIFGLANGSQLNDASHDGSIEQNNENELFSLCLSVGDADGLGHIRKEEYEKSLDVMGIKDTNRIALDDPYLQDSMEVSWDIDYIAAVVADFVIHHNITTILTFDQGGVSDHPNHKIIPFGIQRMISAYPVYPPPKFYVLITVPFSIKYVGILAPLVAKFDLYAMNMLHSAEDHLSWIRNREETMPFFVAGINDYLAALQAMRQHWSQLVWFRWLNVMFSRYMWVNEWAEVKMQAPDMQYH